MPKLSLAVLAVLTGGQCGLFGSGSDPAMTPSEIVLHVNNELWNARDTSVLDVYVAESVDYSTPYSTQSGRKGLLADARQYYEWAESNVSHFKAVAANGSDVFLRWESESTPAGSAKLYNSRGIDYYRVEDGKIVTWKTAHELDSTAANKKRVADIVEELWNQRDLSAVERHFDPEVKVTYENSTSTGRESLTKGASAYFEGWSKSHTRITHLVAEGDSVTIRWVTTGTHTGVYAGVKPTGRTVTYSGSDFYRFEDGRVVETWTFWDRAKVMKTLSSSGYSLINPK